MVVVDAVAAESAGAVVVVSVVVSFFSEASLQPTKAANAKRIAVFFMWFFFAKIWTYSYFFKHRKRKLFDLSKN